MLLDWVLFRKAVHIRFKAISPNKAVHFKPCALLRSSIKKLHLSTITNKKPDVNIMARRKL
jgi:hypothetical protein